LDTKKVFVGTPSLIASAPFISSFAGKLLPVDEEEESLDIEIFKKNFFQSSQFPRLSLSFSLSLSIVHPNKR
jgi:hypothetical protein